MRITDNVAMLIADLEPCIGGNCYNGSSYNGWTGEYGKHFRYPVTYPTTDGSFRKSKYTKENLDLKCVERMYYKTGTNEIYVGAGLVEVLEELEKRFDIDFNKLIEKTGEKEAH
ncbi:MAG: hypothetical protein E7308_10175 [Butyrivibrio sp.]|nr:hypothetical protein [Butyrivibrio sp.]